MPRPKKPKPTGPIPDVDLDRIDKALADIDRHRREIQMAPGDRYASIAGLLAETERCEHLTAVEIGNVILETKRRRQEMRSPWRSFEIGFAFGRVSFAAAIAFFKFLG
jgi:hypothetical protein